ncbi:unnamed protein product [Orchesella dallaii]|uniref:Uncharacterized protein n=1 Tax=Orchesella dallaii TaxID=48710 RepID=A0ABP1Q7Y5_9HEXA
MGKYSVLAISLAFLGVALAQKLPYSAKCNVSEVNGVRVDPCNSAELLFCQKYDEDTICRCADFDSQFHTYREELITTRPERSPKAGKGSKGSSQTTESPKKYNKVYACYSRVGGMCAFNKDNWQSLDSSSSSTTSTDTTTTEAETTLPSSTGSENVISSSATVTEGTLTNETTSATDAAKNQTLDLSKIPSCVQNAVCVQVSSFRENLMSSSFPQNIDDDPRLGVCDCESGYEKTTKDICVKVLKNGAPEKTVAGAVILAALVFNKIFAF